MNGQPNILVVEDDTPIRNLITTTLETQKYPFHIAKNGAQALMEAVSHQPDIILMDLGLPDMDGVEVIRKIRSWSLTSIIVISARSDNRDKIEALDAGADDYLTKPFNVEELLARLRAISRRIRYIESQSLASSSIFINGGLKIDFLSAVVSLEDEELHLTPMEYHLLCLLAKHIGKVLTHQFILKEVWTNSMESDILSLRVYMAMLRKKIEPDKNNTKYIQTHIGIGYRMLKIEEDFNKGIL